MKVILFIDGRNFLDKIRSAVSQKDIDFSIYNFKGLIDKVLSEIQTDERIFYFGKLIEHPDTIEKSKELIEKLRLLKASLEKQKFRVILAGRVRGHIEKCVKGHETLTFKEKGVDVKLAVDMITLACDNKLKTAIIGSSDSDLQPAIKELKDRKIERIYLGFEDNPNKGLTYTTNRTILIRNSEVLEFLGKTLL
ncbi:MAG: hypothetical protein A2998_00405 [Candidatus Staskawiczbacteria bacterium RIFCSPLOWO2_01_FULL_37_25b]|uniref:NYN domain-containing protein n=2 Tax=Candidatus Staskawicziibacteriota TaxID=1817916 RepID=A0A1G2HJN4_9BACT|nr:MAG: hypothetical protein A2812_00535 [Candidatus Staskawiczbacteria bacterium RIFCSPHIGHO2_01_FULL_36_16]OGZ71765.1 MAG: hypothetical protein A2998_00405 [Candidatus Staskawiczbacteria bacterium RIFCSPLOWO2_01_FULL_37_25b]